MSRLSNVRAQTGQTDRHTDTVPAAFAGGIDISHRIPIHRLLHGR